MKILKVLSIILIFSGLSFNASASYAKLDVKNNTSISLENNNFKLDKRVANHESIPGIIERQNISKPNADQILEIILCFLLPPLAVFLHVGIGMPFWISVILTLLGWLPGIVYSLLIVFDVI